MVERFDMAEPTAIRPVEHMEVLPISGRMSMASFMSNIEYQTLNKLWFGSV